MERKPSADDGVEATAGYDDRATRRRQSAFARRKSSAVVEESAAILEAHTLNDADRRLAEMGYTQVRLPTPPKRLHAHMSSISRSTSENSLGCLPSPLPSQSLDSSPVSPQPLSTHLKQEGHLQPSGVGSSPGSDAIASPCPWPNSSQPTLHPEVYTSHANTSRPPIGCRKYRGCAAG